MHIFNEDLLHKLDKPRITKQDLLWQCSLPYIFTQICFHLFYLQYYLTGTSHLDGSLNCFPRISSSLVIPLQEKKTDQPTVNSGYLTFLPMEETNNWCLLRPSIFWLKSYTIPRSPSWIAALPWRRGLSNSEKLWAMPCRDTQDGQDIVASSD